MLSTSQKANSRASRKSGRKSGKTSRLVGVDFGSHSLKLAEVERGPLGPVVRTFGVTPYLKGRRGDVDLVETLKELKAAAHVETTDALLTLAPLDMFMVNHEKYFGSQPSADEVRTTQAQLKGELASKFVNRNVILPVVPAVNQPEQYVRYSFAAIPNQIIDFYRNIMESADIDLAGLQYAPNALGQTLRDSDRTAVLEMGAQTSSWYLYDHGQMGQKATLAYGGEALTDALALANGWSKEQAEEHKRSLTGPSTTWPETSRLVIEAFLQKWWEDLFGIMAESPTYIDKILLTGGGAQFSPLRELVFEKFGVLPEDWTLPGIAHVSEDLRQYLDPHLPILANSLALLVSA